MSTDRWFVGFLAFEKAGCHARFIRAISNDKKLVMQRDDGSAEFKEEASVKVFFLFYYLNCNSPCLILRVSRARA